MDTSIKTMSIRSSSYINNIVANNESFDKGIMYIAYKGQNRNGSYISKKDFENSAATLPYVPVVSNYKIEQDIIGSHDSDYVKDKDGSMKEIVLTEPLGLVPEQPHWFWETVQEKDGSINEYFCCEVLLWKRQPVYEHIKENKITNQSMEISVHDYEMIDGICHIKDFTFTALTLLESAEPCFESASLHMFANTDFKEQMNEMFKDFKAMYSGINTDIENKNRKKEDNKLTKQFSELIKSYGYDPKTIGLDFSNMTIDILTSKLEEMKAADKIQEFLLSSNFTDALYDAISVEKIETEYGMYNRYSIVDYDTDTYEVYAYDMEDYKLYGFTYSISGDTVSIDFKCKKKKKYTIVDFNEGDAEFSLLDFATIVSTSASDRITDELTVQFEKEKEILEAKIDEIKEAYSDYDELKQFKKDTLYNQEKSEKDEIFEKYEESLSELDDFKNLKKHMDEYSKEQIITKCDAIYGKAVREGHVKFNLDSKPQKKKNRIHIGDGHFEEELPYGGIFKEFGISKK